MTLGELLATLSESKQKVSLYDQITEWLTTSYESGGLFCGDDLISQEVFDEVVTTIATLKEAEKDKITHVESAEIQLTVPGDAH